MGKTLSRHGRTGCNQDGGTRSSLRSPGVVLVKDNKVAACAESGDLVRCRIVVDDEYIDRLVRTPRGGRDANPMRQASSSMVVDIPIRVILSPLTSDDANRSKSTPFRWTDGPACFPSTSPINDQPPPPYRQGSNADDSHMSDADAGQRWSVVLDDVGGSPMKFVSNEVQDLLHRLSEALSNSTVVPSTADGDSRVLHLRLVESSSSSTRPVEASTCLPVKCDDASSIEGRLCSAQLTVDRTERGAFRLRPSAARDQDVLETAATQLCSLVDVEVESSPWERLLPEVAADESPTVDQRSVTRPIPCCVARGRHCDLTESCGDKDVDEDDDDRYGRRRKADFDERQLAELVQRNMDLNVLPSRHRWRRSAPVSSPRRHVRCSTDPDDDLVGHCRDSCRPAAAATRTSAVKFRASPHNSPSLPQVRHSALLATAVQIDSCASRKLETISCAVGARCDRSAASREQADGGLATTSSPKCTRNRTHGCSGPNQPRTRQVAVDGGSLRGDNDDDEVCGGADSPRRRKSGAVVAVTSRKHEPEKTVSASHYHRRHRHRARDQSRAMRQVAEWIERAEPTRCGATGDEEGERCGNENVCRHEHYHYHYHYCIDGNAWGVC